jgi:hypothetical protein
LFLERIHVDELGKPVPFERHPRHEEAEVLWVRCQPGKGVLFSRVSSLPRRIEAAGRVLVVVRLEVLG